MRRMGLVAAVILAAISGLAVVVLVGARVALLFVPSDPVGRESAVGRSGGAYRVAIGLCPDEYFDRLSVYESMAEDPPKSSLLWEVRNTLKPAPGKREFTLGSKDGFAHETKQLEATLPKEFQIVYQTHSVVDQTISFVDQFGMERSDSYKVPSGRWYDGNDEVKVSGLHTGGCGT